MAGSSLTTPSRSKTFRSLWRKNPDEANSAKTPPQEDGQHVEGIGTRLLRPGKLARSSSTNSRSTVSTLVSPPRDVKVQKRPSSIFRRTSWLGVGRPSCEQENQGAQASSFPSPGASPGPSELASSYAQTDRSNSFTRLTEPGHNMTSQSPYSGKFPDQDEILGCASSMAQGEKCEAPPEGKASFPQQEQFAILDPFSAPADQSVPASTGLALSPFAAHVESSVLDGKPQFEALSTAPPSSDSEAHTSPPLSPLFPPHSPILDGTATSTGIASDASSIRNSTRRSSGLSSLSRPFQEKWRATLCKPDGPFSPGTVPKRENALPATAWSTLETALHKFILISQKHDAGGNAFERSKLLRLILHSFLDMERDRPLVRPDAPSVPSTPLGTKLSISDSTYSTPASPNTSCSMLSPTPNPPSNASVTSPLTSSATARQHTNEAAFDRFKCASARQSLLHSWISELMRAIGGAHSPTDRVAILDSICLLLEARNFSIDALSTPETNQEERERYHDALYMCLEYAIDELNKKGVYQNSLLFAGRILALVFIRIPGSAEKLLCALPINRPVLQRVASEARWAHTRPSGAVWDEYVHCFPEHLRDWCFYDARSYLSRVRAVRPPQEPEEDIDTRYGGQSPSAEDVPFLAERNGRSIAMKGNWLRRFQSDDSELIFSFLRNFHRQLEHLVRTSLPAEVHENYFGAPGFAHIAASIHQKGLSLVHRSLTSVTRQQLTDAVYLNSPGETANVLLGNTSGKPKHLEIATTRCVSAVIHMVTFGDARPGNESQKRLFLPSIQWHLALLVNRTSLYDVQGIFCLLDWIDALLDSLVFHRMQVHLVIDMDFLVSVVRRILLETEHTLSLMRALAFCYSNFALLMSTTRHRRQVADEMLLSPPIFSRLLLSWSPAIRTYFLRLIVFRLGHLTDFPLPRDDPQGNTTIHITCLLNERFNDIRSHFLKNLVESEQTSSEEGENGVSQNSGVFGKAAEASHPVSRNASAPIPNDRKSPASSPRNSCVLTNKKLQAKEHLASNTSFHRQPTESSTFSSPVYPCIPMYHPLHPTTASQEFIHRSILCPGPAASLLLTSKLKPTSCVPFHSLPTSREAKPEIMYDRKLQPYAAQCLREFEQIFQEHDNLMASLPPEQRADVPLLTVAWPAMWQGE